MLQKSLLLFAVLVCLAISLFNSSALAADILGPSCTSDTQHSAVCQQDAKQKGNNDSNPITKIISEAANGLALLGGIAAVIMIIISGLRFITAGGTGFKSTGPNATAAAKARTTLFNAIIGLVIIALAWTIVRLITDKVLK